jgi:tRNA A-37 threonylcarbamoyl transferase component Bud32
MNEWQEEIECIRSELLEAITHTRAEVDSQEYDISVLKRSTTDRLEELEESERNIWDVFNRVGQDMQAVVARLDDLDRRFSRIDRRLSHIEDN